MERLKRHWKSVPKTVRKPLVFMVGTFIVIVGLILLPLPGPGWVVIFLGFTVLATEFALAEKVRAWIIGRLKFYLNKIKR